MLTFIEFRKTFCSYCKCCTATYVSNDKQSFCYSIYKKAPTTFTKHIYVKLKKLGGWPKYYYDETKAFKDIFCTKKTCFFKTKNECIGKNLCLNNFIKQNILSVDDSYFSYKKEPTTCFIAGGSKEWVEFTKKFKK